MAHPRPSQAPRGERALTAAVFLDRDGTLVVDRDFLAREDEVEFIPGAQAALAALKRAGFLLVVVTNQSGLARGLFGQKDLERIHTRIERELAHAGAPLDLVLVCPHHPSQGLPPLRRVCDCRKPAPGLFLEAARRLPIDLERSVAVGDSRRDLEAARRAGVARGLLVLTGKGASERALLTPEESRRIVVVDDLAAAAASILAHAR